VAAASPLPAAETLAHDHRLIALYYVIAIAVLSLYGIRVCPFVASLDPRSVLATFAVAFGVAFALKLAFEPRLMPAAAPFTLSVYQFAIDFGLFLAVGVGITLWNRNLHGFPVESGYKVMVGCAAFGLFAGLDNGLRRERRTPALASDLTTPPRRIFPITDRLLVIFAGIAVLTGIVAALVIAKDIDWALSHAAAEPAAKLKRAVLIDIGFVVATVLLLSLRLLWAYGRNLAWMLELQLRGLDEVSNGRLQHYIPVITRDEFSLIACRTNLVIDTLRRANREQRELFEVSLALARELRLDPLLAHIIATTRSFVEAERVTLFLHDRERDELWSKIAEGVKRELRFPADEGIAGHVFQSGESTIVADAYADARFNPALDRATGYRTRNLLCVPIVDRDGNRIGVIQALNRLNGQFTAVDAERLRAFAAQASVALVNAELFADLDRARRYTESVLASLSNGVITLDAEGRIAKANPVALDVLDLEAHCVGKEFGALLAEPKQWWQGLARNSSGAVLDAEVGRRDGTHRSVNVVRDVLPGLDDNVPGSILVLDDVTEEKRVRSTLSRYLPSAVVDQLLADQGVGLGGVSQTATVLFSDIRDFTTISERIGPRETVSMLNEYFSLMAEAISAHHGIIDKYVGDAVMAVFGVPYAGAADADNAVAAALAMIERLDHLNRLRAERGQEALATGIGLSTGDVVAGNVGSAKHMDYTVIGDTVNLSARLESATKTYGVRLLISGQTRAALQRPWRLRELDRIRVKGKGRAVALFQVISDSELMPPAAMEAFRAGRARYAQRDFSGAITAFESVLRDAPNDTPSVLLRERCQELIAAPPPNDWDGVWEVR
jgi:adenylate cyclase